MKIGILSDTHNNLANLDSALMLFEQQGISTLVHCGDFTGVEVAKKLAPFQVICTFGNGDFVTGEIRQELMHQRPDNYAGMVFAGQIENTRIAVTHGHLPGKMEELIHSGKYEYVFVGHSHQHRDEKYAATRLINPGALGGMHREERRICILDLSSGKAEFVKITGT